MVKAHSSTQTAKQERVQSVEAILDGYDRKYAYLRVPKENGGGDVGLTLSRRWLRHGFASTERMQVKIDYASLRHTGRGYVADVVIERSIDANKQNREAPELHQANG